MTILLPFFKGRFMLGFANGAKEERLRGPEKFTPGPGAYQNANGWNKKSFNISLDDTGLI